MRDRWLARLRSIERPANLALTVIVGATVVVRNGLHVHTRSDPYSYWTYRLADNPWAYPPNFHVGNLSVSHPYSPAFAQVIAPLQALPFPWFMALWTAITFGVLVFLIGRWAGLAAILLPPVTHQLANPNVDLVLASAAVLAFRWPGMWAVVLLTKITPGIGLLWFAARREWRSLAIALGVTAAVVLTSATLSPGAWPSWIGWLIANATGHDNPNALPIPLLARLPVATLVVLWGARTDRRWAVPLAMWLALPSFSLLNSVMLLGAVSILASGDLRTRWATAEGVRSRLIARAVSAPR